ncbi:Unknown protein, partial [Striga hermonthica]
TGTFSLKVCTAQVSLSPVWYHGETGPAPYGSGCRARETFPSTRAAYNSSTQFGSHTLDQLGTFQKFGPTQFTGPTHLDLTRPIQMSTYRPPSLE